MCLCVIDHFVYVYVEEMGVNSVDRDEVEKHVKEVSKALSVCYDSVYKEISCCCEYWEKVCVMCVIGLV